MLHKPFIPYTTRPLNETNGGSENLQTYSLMLESNSPHPTLAEVFDIHEEQSVAPKKDDEESPFNTLCEYLHWLKRDSIKSLSMTHAVSRNYPSLHFLLASTIKMHQKIARLATKPQVESNSLFYQCCEAIVSNPRSANGLRQLDGAPGIYYAGGGSYRLFIAYPKNVTVTIDGVLHYLMFKVGISIANDEGEIFSIIGSIDQRRAKLRAKK